MLENLNHLTEDEQQELFDAIPVITLLIAGADGNIEEDELEWSEKITKIRGYSGTKSLQAYYDKVGEDYHDRLMRWKNVLPKDTAERTLDLSARLTKLNPILAKLDQELGAEFYESFTSFAKHVAKSAGGILGFGSINKAEAKLINLPMLDPIIVIEDEEEES